MADFLKLVGERIRSIRKAQGMTQEGLAEKAGLHFSYIGSVERGERNISLETLEKIIRALNVSPEKVFQFQDIHVESESENKSMVLKVHEALLQQKSLEEIKMIHKITKEIFQTMDSKRKES